MRRVGTLEKKREEKKKKKSQNKERPGVCQSSKNVAECLVCARLGAVLRPMRKCMSKTEIQWAGGWNGSSPTYPQL